VGADVEEDGHHPEKKYKLTDDTLHQVHTAWDENGDNQVSKQELAHFVEKQHQDVALADLDNQLKQKDVSKDGLVSLEEHLVSVDTGDSATFKPAAEFKARLQAEQKSLEAAKFKAADTNSDGLLDRSELAAIVSPGTHASVLNVMVKHSMGKADLDGNGKLTFDEFVASPLYADAHRDAKFEEVEGTEDEEDQQKEIFSMLDKDGDSYIDAHELGTMASGGIKRETMVSEVIASVDQNGDAHIDSTELIRAKDFMYDSDLQNYLIAWAKRHHPLGR